MLEDVVTTMPTSAAVGEHDVQLPDGVRLRCLVQGPASGPAVLLLHGYSDSSFSWSRVMPLLPADLRVVAPDQRGHGRSDRPARGYTVDDFAGDAVAVLDALGIRTATIVGHSMGSFVARRIAEQVPERVERLVLLGSGPAADNAVLRDLLHAVSGLSDPVDPAFVREFQMSCVARPVPEAFMERVVASSRAVPARVWKAALTSLVEYRPCIAVRCPTLVIGGDADSVFSAAEQAQLARDIPAAALVLEPGVGHALNWEDPERFVASLVGFLRAGTHPTESGGVTC